MNTDLKKSKHIITMIKSVNKHWSKRKKLGYLAHSDLCAINVIFNLLNRGCSFMTKKQADKLVRLYYSIANNNSNIIVTEGEDAFNMRKGKFTQSYDEKGAATESKISYGSINGKSVVEIINYLESGGLVVAPKEINMNSATLGHRFLFDNVGRQVMLIDSKYEDIVSIFDFLNLNKEKQFTFKKILSLNKVAIISNNIVVSSNIYYKFKIN